MQPHPQGIQQDQADEDDMLPLDERILNQKWRIRFEAYKEINALFYNEYSKRELGENVGQGQSFE